MAQKMDSVPLYDIRMGQWGHGDMDMKENFVSPSMPPSAETPLPVPPHAEPAVAPRTNFMVPFSDNTKRPSQPNQTSVEENKEVTIHVAKRRFSFCV